MKSQQHEASSTGAAAVGIPAARAFGHLWQVIRRLRAPGGCAWDREQDFTTMKPRFLEEVYEFIDALEQGDQDGMQEELGDLFFHLLFMSLLGEERESWTLEMILTGIAEKLIRRHPHVFAHQATVQTSSEVINQWEEIKKRVEGKDYQSLLDNVPRSLPPFQKALVHGRKCHKIGFDWPAAAEILPKIREELQEVEEAMAAGEPEALAEELGDVLLVLVSLLRHLDLDPDHVMRSANRKFEKRFRFMEQAARLAGDELAHLSLDEQEALWEQAKEHTD
ncbi:MAG: nucleoside triphosphate pyrophosphohydrolase [Deltaproteobacteria bacterium]|nr:nucleoside triphosphate pyrophosphohydrolase [Candidatus Anaeroferrophillus wilburensis]MBN2890005.1 nucleoside triphosphate pyrophosphohydrolase [Deltaproteobacteria bacterium]